MQSSTTHLETFYSSLGERRGKSDLARFSLDSSWARAVSDSARSRAYPSPPMSGSPPLPPRHNPDSSNRGHGGYGSSGQDLYQGTQTPPLRAYHTESHSHQGYPASSRMDETSSAPLSYQQRPPQPLAPQMYHQPPHPYPQHHAQPPAPFSAAERPPTGETPEFVSPKAQRKTKGHVASACVPCKRAHLRCDAQRPCSRCSANGKEDACIDVQHKKRGRPRLRDEREQRLGYESMSGSGSGYPHPSEGGMRRPLSMYSSNTAAMNTDFGESIHRSGSYRVLKSQGGPIAPRYLDHASAADANISSGFMMPAPRMLPPQEPPCAYLTMKMQVAKATSSFNDIVGVPGGVVKNFQDLVLGNEREKVAQLQRIFEDERRQREPHYLPPISFNTDEERIIQSVGFGPEVTGQLRFDHTEVFAFSMPASDGSQRSFQARFGLGKKDATYFIAMVIHVPTPAPMPVPITPQPFHQAPLSSPYSRDSYSRGSTQYEYQTPQQTYAPAQVSPQFMGNPAYGDPREQMTFRAPMQGSGPMPLGQNIPPTTMPPFSRPPSRPEYSQGQMPYQTPRSELPQTQPPRQHDLQLPPIRDQRGEASSADAARRRDDRNNRVDIGGLLENPRGSH